MQHVTPDQAREQLFELIDAAINGEDVFITTDGEQVVQLVPVMRPKRRRQFGSARGLFVMSEDFDDPLPDFDDYRE
jgi:antitoxin (DNA-binding transcriptional repressor) of toxin-antitoxin stability system